jgi:hypothetical protein
MGRKSQGGLTALGCYSMDVLGGVLELWKEKDNYYHENI